MSFICFAHIKASRNLKSLFFPPYPLLLRICSPLSLSAAHGWPVSLHYQCWGSVDRKQGQSDIKILANLEREKEVKKTGGGGVGDGERG